MSRPDLFDYDNQMGSGPGPLGSTQGGPEETVYAPGFVGTQAQLRATQEETGVGQVGGARRRVRKTRRRRARNNRGILKRRYGRTRGGRRGGRRRVRFTA